MTNLELKSFNVDINNNALKSKKLPNRIKVLNWGKNDTTDGPVYLNDKTLAVFNSYQNKTGRDKDVALDFDHCTVSGSKEYVQGEPKSIAAYGNPVLIKNDGLYLDDLDWTPLGEKNARNYKDLSPAAVTDPNGTVLGLHSVALTPNGAVNGLKFYSAKGFDDMIRKMSVSDQGASNAQDITIKDADSDYNKDGANPSLTKTSTGFKLNPHVMDATDDNEMDDEHNEDDENCMCASCMSAKVQKFDANDHYSEYGNVEYADKKNHKYPIDTEKHVRAAWSYINMPKNASKYDSSELSTIKGHIKNAMKKHGIKSDDSGKAQTKTMSANNTPILDAYKAQPWQYNTMNDSIIKEMAAQIGMEGETDAQKVLFAFLAEYKKLAETSQQITKHDNTEEGGLKQFSAKDFEALKKEVETLKTQKAEELQRHTTFERETLVKLASKEGKIIPLSADEVKTVDVNILRSIINNQPKNVVPLNAKLKTLSAKSDSKPTREATVAMFKEQVAALQ